MSKKGLGFSDEKMKNNLNYPIINAAIFGIFLWVLCYLLANLEVQIEGANGWASQLPTWRSFDPRLTWIFGGRPVTGYHVYLNLLLLSFFHFPLVLAGFSWEKEARLLSGFMLLAVVWDFLWFVVNPHFGMQKYSAENIWWFKHWVFGFPVDYYFGIVMSFIVMTAPAIGSRKLLSKLTCAWGVQFSILFILTTLIVLIY